VLAAGYHPRHSLTGIAWTAVTAVVMFALAAGKTRQVPIRSTYFWNTPWGVIVGY
jgi:hypothetical protein